MADEIIYCDGIYEVHPSVNGGSWIVVNSQTGNVRQSGMSKDDAIKLATELNSEIE